MPTTRGPLFLTLCAAAAAAAAACRAAGGAPGAPPPLPSIEDFTARLEALPGFLPTWWDGEQGKVYFEPRPDGEELLHVVSLPAGLGSNAVGLDRAQLGPRRLVVFHRAGARVLLIAPATAWIAGVDAPEARAAVADSFASSVLSGLELVAASEGRVLVDATPLLLSDAHGVAARLRETGQGAFALDPARSAPLRERSRGFPDNTELEALLTFAGEQPGPEVRATASEPTAVSVRVRHSFVRLPDLQTSGYRPRRADPRAGFHTTERRDLAAPIDAPQLVPLLNRHDLRPGGPPIVYWVDRAAPEPVRSALLDGVRFWEPVFAAAGLPGGFKAELLPEGADPQDVRTNVLTWVHRASRGWSYGETVVDPRTGEILKGHVSLGSLRVRQDVLLAEGLLAPYAGGAEYDERVQAAALARIRQLAAHEVGHTLGLQHNFAASTAERASVMDYPPPRVLLAPDGAPDLAQAYATGCGRWDELAVRYGYAWCAPEDEQAFLARALAEIEGSGIPFLTDADARGPDRAHPLANLWDDGADPVASLEHALLVRRAALLRFGEGAVPGGEPLAALEEALLPVYFHHRYQLEAAVRQLGGVGYRHAVRGGLPADVAPVPADVQRAALAAALRTLEPDFLRLPPDLLALIPPAAPGADPAGERFAAGALPLDPDAAGAAAIALTLELLLDPARAARLARQAREDPEQPGFDEVLRALIDLGWARTGEDTGELRAQCLERLFDLAVDEHAALGAQRAAWEALEDLRRMHAEGRAPEETPEERRQGAWERPRLEAFFADPLAPRARRAPPPVPPGAPIGSGGAGAWGACGFDFSWLEG